MKNQITDQIIKIIKKIKMFGKKEDLKVIEELKKGLTLSQCVLPGRGPSAIKSTVLPVNTKIRSRSKLGRVCNNY